MNTEPNFQYERLQGIIKRKDREVIEMYFNSGDEGFYPKIETCKILISYLQKIIKLGGVEIEKHNKDLRDRYWEEGKYKPIRQPKQPKTEIPPAPAVPGYIYLIKDGKFFKIGKAKNFDARRETYITENPRELKVVFHKKVTDYNKTEKEILDNLDLQKHYRGEWYISLHKNDIKKIEEIIKKYE
jgi:hypothetical protein